MPRLPRPDLAASLRIEGFYVTPPLDLPVIDAAPPVGHALLELGLSGAEHSALLHHRGVQEAGYGTEGAVGPLLGAGWPGADLLALCCGSEFYRHLSGAWIDCAPGRPCERGS